MKSELLYGRQWFSQDLERLITFYYYIRDPTTSTLFSTLRQLRHLAHADCQSTFKFPMMYTFSFDWDYIHYFEETPVRCQSEDCIFFVALQYGLYEFWPTNDTEDKIRVTLLRLITTSLEEFWLNDHDRLAGLTPPPFDRLLRSLAICLADGVSANLSIQDDVGSYVTTSVWQTLVWYSIVKGSHKACVAPVWLIFLLHGADTSFTLTLEQTSNFSAREKTAKMMTMTGYWGQDNYQAHSPILIDEDDDGIVGLARSRNWSVSLKELTYFWFAPYADDFRKIFELTKDNGRIPAEDLKNLRQELGFDPECWQDQMWRDPQPLLRHPWVGISTILEARHDKGLRTDAKDL
jgi:hypothetical protein